MNYQITPIYLGKSRTDRSTLLLRYPPGEATDITYYAFLLRGEDGETVLFDTGTPEPEIMQQPDWKSARFKIQLVVSTSDIFFFNSFPSEA